MKQVGTTPEGGPVVDGVFFYVGTKGVPLDAVVHTLKSTGVTVCWLSYIRDSMAEGAKLKNIRARIVAAVSDVYGPKYCEGFTQRLDEVIERLT